VVVTNGTVDAPGAVEACEATCDAVVFSPHPPEELGGGGALERWDAAWAGFARLRAGLRRAELTVGITLGRHTAPRLDEILERAVGGGADRIRLQAHFSPRLFPTAPQLAEMRRVLEHWTLREPRRMDDRTLFLDHLESYFSTSPYVTCTAHRRFNLGVYLDGSVSACCPERVIIGNLFREPLATMRARPEQMRTDCFGCHRTDVIVAKRYCGEG
jgi:hypothetical protein